mgnify:CR=1 FL=1
MFNSKCLEAVGFSLSTDFNGWTGLSSAYCRYVITSVRRRHEDSSFKPTTKFYQSIDFCLSNSLCEDIIIRSSYYYDRDIFFVALLGKLRKAQKAQKILCVIEY